jgi:hypothetical protein
VAKAIAYVSRARKSQEASDDKLNSARICAGDEMVKWAWMENTDREFMNLNE